MPTFRLAVLVPCFNEAHTVRKVVEDFRRALPEAVVHVFDNASDDGTADLARSAGARVARVPLRGKGHVVRRLFADVEADVYLLVDGDDTYSADCAPRLVRAVLDGHDMVVGVREATATGAYRAGHAWGNRALTGFLAWLFGRSSRDILSGYRAFSRRFVKSFPVQSSGFEIETELTVHALQMHMPVAELATPYGERPQGSQSKLSTWKDGFRILGKIATLFARERPVAFYGNMGGGLLAVALLLSIPLLVTYAQSGLVPRFPTAILVAALLVMSALALLAGVILDSVARGRREVRFLAYLAAAPGPGELSSGGVAAERRRGLPPGSR
ncbi:glycosyltransferase [Luteimonas sp. RD2P54]|uniref:Glycosyltransferase n=1 Tax=Luteimonas endophytica TaxID=3042023 RepID=A0ABT6J9E6_9GAMM|nr:glycosyltransferase [Luteimonas endophytica]MDH5822808.1 glycosyltransferase [Luteimonas endophytica]